jgi:hypothetical protein
MRSGRPLAPVVVAFILILQWPLVAGAAGAPYAGRRVAEVLRELQGEALEFLFSSQLVADSLLITTEPRPASPLETAREILGSHGLELSLIRPGRYAVVRTRNPRPAGTAESSGSRSERTSSVTSQIPLAEVVVSTSRYAAGSPASSSAFVLAGTELAAQPGLGEDSVRTLARLPGIAQSGLSAQSNIRGGETGEVLLLLDGFPLRQAFHLPGYQSVFSILDPTLIGSAEVFTGGFPARYGNRMSGVFDLNTPGTDRRPRRAFGLSFFNATALQSGRLDRLALDYLGATRIGTLKPFMQAFAPGTGAPSYSDVFSQLTFGDEASIRLTGNFLWARDELAISSRSRGERAEVESRSHYAWLRADRTFNPDLAASLWVGHSQIDSVRGGTLHNPGFATGLVEDSRSSQFWDLRGRVSWQVRESHWLESGFEWTDEAATYRYRAQAQFAPPVAVLFGRDEDLDRAINVAPARQRVAAFATHRWRLSDAIATEVGLRIQRQLTRGAETDWSEDPRVSVRWQLSPKTSLRAHWGRFHQADEVQELAVDDGLENFPAAQRTDQLILGFEHRFADGIGLRIEGFRKDQSGPRPRFENLLNPLSILPEIAPDRTSIVPQFVEISGLEVSLNQESTDWSRWGSLTWSNAKDDIQGRDLPRSWDQTWAAVAGVNWRRGKWQFGVVGSAHRGWPSTGVFELEDGTAQLGERNARRLPLFASVDLRAQYQQPAWNGTMTYGFELSNALNRRNACCLELSVVPSETGAPTFATRELSWLPLIPSLSVKWEQ